MSTINEFVAGGGGGGAYALCNVQVTLDTEPSTFDMTGYVSNMPARQNAIKYIFFLVVTAGHNQGDVVCSFVYWGFYCLFR